MNVDTAVGLLNDLIFIPDWEIEAEDFSARFEGAVKVSITYPARLANRECAPDYPDPIRPTARFAFLVGDCDDDVSLYFKFTNKALEEIASHEIREFLRVRSTGWAPFHPHRIDGMKRWAEFTGQADVDKDLSFGIV